jgi:tetratricopeptide (TPR) repeat protein
MFHKGAAYSRLGDFERALTMYQMAERLSPDNPRLPLNMAIAYDHLQQYDPAIEHYTTYLSRNKSLGGVERRNIERRISELRVYLSRATIGAAADSEETPETTE